MSDHYRQQARRLRQTARQLARRLATLTRRQTARPATSSAAADIVLEAFRAIEQRDHARLEALYHPEVEFHWPQSLVHIQPGSNWEQLWDPLQPTERERAMSPRLIAANDHEVVVLWRQRGRAPDGDRFDCEVLGLYEVRDHRFARAQMFYFDTAGVVRFLENADTARGAGASAQRL